MKRTASPPIPETQDSPAQLERGEGGTQAIDRALAVLFAFRPERPSFRPTELSDLLGLNKSTVYRMLQALAAAGLVRRDPGDGGIYRLGPTVLDLADTFLSTLDLRALARPEIEALVREHGESVNLAVIDDCDAIKIDSMAGTRTPQLMSRLGQRIPLLCSSAGKALLLDHDDDAIRALYVRSALPRLTARTITDPELFLRRLKQWRSSGWTLNDEESEIGMRAIGAPIRDHTGAIVASISLSMPTFRADDARVRQLGKAVKVVAERISMTLGANLGRVSGARRHLQKTD